MPLAGYSLFVYLQLHLLRAASFVELATYHCRYLLVACVLRADKTRAALVHEVQLAAPVVSPALRGAPNQLRRRCCTLVRQSTLL